jgi:hypothetical protein
LSSRNLTKQQAENGFLNLRRIVCKRTEEAFSKELGFTVEVKDISVTAIYAWRSQWVSNRIPPNGGWNWEEQYYNIKKIPNRFGISIWHDGLLY